MNIQVYGKLIGKPFQNKKKTGFLCKIAQMDEDNNIEATPMVFSQDLKSFEPDSEGFVSIECNFPDFLLANS